MFPASHQKEEASESRKEKKQDFAEAGTEDGGETVNLFRSSLKKKTQGQEQTGYCLAQAMKISGVFPSSSNQELGGIGRKPF